MAAERAFADHHPYSEAEIGALIAEAGRDGLTLATTEKDFVRLGTAPGTEAIVPFKVTMAFADPAALRRFVTGRLGAARAKQFGR